jgi:phage terminase small subunit
LAGVLGNRKHEKFAQLYVQGKPIADSYIAAGYRDAKRRSAEVCATRLLRDVTVRRRIGELQRQAVESTDITVASLLAEAAAIQRDAMRAGNQSAAIAALTAKAKIAGLWVEKTESENTNLHYVICDELPSEQQWIEERVKQ